jgi:hypothetical protein
MENHMAAQDQNQITDQKDNTNGTTDTSQSQPDAGSGTAGSGSDTGSTGNAADAGPEAPAAPAAGNAEPAQSAAPVVQSQAVPPVQQAVAKPAAPAPAPKPAAPAPVAPVAAPAPQQQQVILSPRASALFEDLDAYIAAMDPKKPANPKAGATQQARLYRLIQHIINQLQEDFRPAFVTLLKKFDEHSGLDGVFHPLNVFRFFPHVPLGDEDRETFRNLLNMLTKLASPKSRAPMLKQINLRATLAGKSITEPGRQRVNAFFGL